MTERNYKVYRHVFPNGKTYIGITKQTLKRRFGNGSGYKKCPKVYAAILKYGWDNVEHELLYSGLTKEEAEHKEIELIAVNNSIKNGYNIEHGGNVQGTHSIETKRKISEGNKGKQKQPFTDERKKQYSKMFAVDNNPFYGKHHKEEVRKEHSRFMTGNQYNKGHHHSEEFKKEKSKQMSEKYKNGGNPRCKKVVGTSDNGDRRIFVSLRNAANVLGVSVATMYKYVHEGTKYGGYKWGYLNEY